MNPRAVVVTGAFDNPRSREVRFLEEAARLGAVTVCLWSDRLAQEQTGQPPKFPEAERLYFLNAIRFVSRVRLIDQIAGAQPLPDPAGFRGAIWADEENPDREARLAFSRQAGLEYRVLAAEQLAGYPEPPAPPAGIGPKKVIVTGSYDWFHTGHIRFFEEASAYGDLYVVVGHDANIRLLKGEGHPLWSEAERRYLVGAVKFVTQALISTGTGWLDADPEIQRLKPDLYVVNEDGDRGGKREYCEKRGIQYLVLKREPAPGLPARSSTRLRGF